jgi:hypothetical protein
MKTSTRRKALNLDQELIKSVRRLLYAKTDTEAIRRALHKAIEDHEIQGALDMLLRKGRFRTTYR